MEEDPGRERFYYIFPLLRPGTMKKLEKILVFTGSGIITPRIAGDCVSALLHIGTGAALMDVRYNLEKGPESARDNLRRALNEVRPDLILSVDCGVVREFPELFASLNIPVAAWFVDDPLFIITKENIFDNLYVFTWDRIFTAPLREAGCRFVEYLPLGTDPSTFRRLPPDAPECAGFRCDVSFVGSSLADRRHEKETGLLIPDLEEIFSLLVARHAEMPHPPAARLLAEIEARKGIKLQPEARFCLAAAAELEAMMLFRSRALNELAAFKPHVYGDAGWTSLLKDGPVYRGPIDYAAGLPKLYSASRINLNVSKSQLRTAVNQRVFDAPACGGFVLTDYREDAERLFDPETEIAVYKSLEDMKAKVSYFLENEEERTARARRARRRVLAEHTYVHRMKHMLEMLAEVL